MSTALVITIAIIALASLVALVIVRPTDVDVAARGLRVRLRRRADHRPRERDGDPPH